MTSDELPARRRCTRSGVAQIVDPDGTELIEAVDAVPDFNSQDDLDKYIAHLEEHLQR